MPAPRLPFMKSIDCIVALQRAGFSVTSTTRDSAVLRRGPRVVLVRRHRLLSPLEVELVLRAAGVPVETFAERLHGGPQHPAGECAPLDGPHDRRGEGGVGRAERS